jgi:phage gp36-like protein
MSRATITQLRQLGLDSYAIDKVPDADKQVALDAAMARVNAALRCQIGDAVVVAPFPMDIVQCECVLASWTLLMAQGYNPAKEATDKNVDRRYEEWAEYLDKVAKGELVPAVMLASSSSDAGATGPSVITSSQRGYSERGSNCVGPFSSD